MGTRFAPSYANLHMGYWEECHVLPYLELGASLVLWRRYIDDIVLVWRGSASSLCEYVASLNQNDLNIDLSLTYSYEKINFLDLEIYSKDTQLHFKTFFKEVDANNYVLPYSNHHPQWVKSIPFSQMCRLKKNCSEDKVLEEQLDQMSNKFRERGYKERTIKESREKVDKIIRTDLLGGKVKVNKGETKQEIVFSTTYNPLAKSIGKIIKRHWGVLQCDIELRGIIPDKPKVVFKRANNLKQILTNNHCIKKEHIHKEHTWAGFYPCSLCTACRYGKKKKKFTSEVNKREFEIKQNIRCTTKNVIYCLQCPCGIQYVGKTNRKLRDRIREHVNNIKKGNEKHTVSKHFRDSHGMNPAGLQYWGVEEVKKRWRGGDLVKTTLQCESRWIYSLETFTPKGLNVDINLRAFL
ncbi:uncharacterized protein LOC121394669 [Xenopus laevis]|uniref:Uncharacterized protein LOC121394669 n=1 Tax=Xenopus laevis TaxID=8355 RepID=A0A8J1KXX0_XENLA|nr:uncharacterized protein LOC121394669 [Xenopus laevis]XP_041422162.1 uncharacterized protein LOC121394669 [Xenopus laevis]